jgi:2,3-bisphosphoglycerate-dependent phosphoglycerate mutase
MKIYILRHEERPSDCSFYTPLTKQGLNNAKQLILDLNDKEIKIDMIISSPFIRTLQTIYPYASNKKLKINLEYGLSEIHTKECITERAVGMILPEYIADSFECNKEYESIIKHNEIKYPENINDVKNRINKILKHLICKYKHTETNILLVTHQSLCISGLEKLIKSSNINIEIKNKLKCTNIKNDYTTGKLCLIFNKNQWEFEEINKLI